MDKNTEFICFTSSAGASGCSSAAISFSRILSLLYSERILYLCFDPFPACTETSSFGKGGTGLLLLSIKDSIDSFSDMLEKIALKDDFGVYFLPLETTINPFSSLDEHDLNAFLSAVSDCGNFSKVVLDVPFASINDADICCCCEKVIIAAGYTETQKRRNKALKDFLGQFIDNLSKRPEITFFEPLRDDESFENGEADIHGQFGAEVRELAAEFA